MYTFIVNSDHTLTATVKEVIMQRSNINKIQFLVPKYFEDYDLSNTVVHMGYTLPSGKPGVIELTLVSSDYKGRYLQYIIDVTSSLTAESGDINFNLNFIGIELNEDGNLNAEGAGAHNAVYRGKYLGASVTAAQYAAIVDGSFDNLYIGDYWTISGINYRIAAFDYYYRAGDTECTAHHVTIVPDNNMYNYVINDSDVTTGGYYGSKMYRTGLTQAKTTINAAFTGHVLNHRQYLCNAVSSGKQSAGAWYDSTIELMTEQNVYGGKVYTSVSDGNNIPTLYTIDKSQYPLFLYRPDLISNRNTYWLRDVVSSALFARVDSNGGATRHSASNSFGVRPAFSIY